jgi:hypothetical protein
MRIDYTANQGMPTRRIIRSGIVARILEAY